MKKTYNHLFHLVDKSPWPMLVSFGLLFMTMFLVLFTARFIYSLIFMCLNLTYILYAAYNWWKDINNEATLGGHHTVIVKRGLWLGFILFMSSEIMVFFVFFWSYFHYSLTPIYDIGYLWPGVGIDYVKTLRLPLLNTFILILSVATLTISHKSLLLGDLLNTKIYLILTLVLGLIFEIFQVIEYVLTSFNFNDSVYGNVFYFLTGLHGFHVFVGIIFLFISYLRLEFGYVLYKSHVGFEFAIWYWHFVDFVWIILFFIVYLW